MKMRSLACLLLLSTVAVDGTFGKCPNPQAPEFGIVTIRQFGDGITRVMYSCVEGRRLKGNKIASCIGDIWDRPTPTCVIRNPVPHLRLDLYAGDEPARESISEESKFQVIKPQESKLRESEHQDVEKDRSQLKSEPRKRLHHGGDASKKGRRAREHRKNGGKRRKASQEEPLSNVAGATRLNETVVSQLDTSCAKKNLKKRSVKAPSIEHTHKPRYARSL